MQYITQLKLATVHQMCDAEDKSTEFMIQFMMDSVGVSHDTVINYLSLTQEKKINLFKDLNSLLDVVTKSSEI